MSDFSSSFFFVLTMENSRSNSCLFFSSSSSLALESRTTIHKSSKGPISVAECDAQGKYVLIENTSRSKSIALAGWTLRQENDNGDILTFTFPDNCLLRPNHTIKVRIFNRRLISVHVFFSSFLCSIRFSRNQMNQNEEIAILLHHYHRHGIQVQMSLQH